MYKIIALGIFIFLLFRFVSLRVFVFHIISSIAYFLYDFVAYFYHLSFNKCKTGELICFAGLFGSGKTLSAVKYVRNIYKRYNNKLLYDEGRKKWVVQKVIVLSNVKINDIPFIPLNSLGDIVNNAYTNKAIDEENNTRTVILALIDEASVQLNSRSFKSNINTDFLNTLLTSRHYNISLYYTSQRFFLTDKLLRDVSQQVIECKKYWRFQTQAIYDASELENAANPDLIKPRFTHGWFVRNSDYRAYDTLAVVDSLKKSFDTNDFLSPSEILELRSPSGRFAVDNAKELKLLKKIARRSGRRI